MTKNKKILVTLNCILIMLLSSCAYYKPPTSGPTATINFRHSDNLLGYHVFIFKNPYVCSGPRRQAEKKFKIPAKRLFTFMVSYMEDDGATTSFSCSIIASFIPDSDQQYEGNFSYGKRHCYISVNERLAPQVSKIMKSNMLPIKLQTRAVNEHFLAKNFCSDEISQSYENSLLKKQNHIFNKK